MLYSCSQAIASIALLLCLAACSDTPLDYETAMVVLKDANNEVLRVKFSATPRAPDPNVMSAYRDLNASHVLDCKDTARVGVLCVPGPAGDIVGQDGTSDLSVVAGHWAPSSIVALQRTGRNSAQADVRMTFEPTTLYREFQSQFDAIQYIDPTAVANDRKQGKMMHAVFERYEDGWHLESLQ